MICITNKIDFVSQLLMSPNLLMSGRQDAACSAVMGAAVAVGGRMFLPSGGSSSANLVNMACCPHCSGEVKQVWPRANGRAYYARSVEWETDDFSFSVSLSLCVWNYAPDVDLLIRFYEIFNVYVYTFTRYFVGWLVDAGSRLAKTTQYFCT